MANDLSRKQRLRTLEKEIREGMEEFCYIGQKLKEIRDDLLYKEDGFETWEKYCRERWDWSRSYSHQVITAAEYRAKLPDVCHGQTSDNKGWTEKSVRELTRIPDKRDAARVATKVLKAVAENQKQRAKDPDVKEIKFSSSIVRRFVDEDLGIDRSAKAQKTKASRFTAETRRRGAAMSLIDVHWSLERAE